MPQLSVILGLLLTVLGGDFASAQTDPRIFEALDGRWEGEGTLFDRPARFEMQWERVNGVAVLTFTNGMIDTTGVITPVLGAVAIYRTAVATPRGTWEDTRGIQVQIAWTATDSTLVSSWTAPTEEGRTTYTVTADGTIDVFDEVMRQGALAPFGQATYRRVPGTRCPRG
jgi:hypothetical protein